MIEILGDINLECDVQSPFLGGTLGGSSSIDVLSYGTM